ncbi:hypothetical protein KIPB_014125 [Kipferlia bialata]|uniref:Secreted protein n=1 Tax=Kipferlia bialata TaxID=797122 RepID=A0A391NZH2_9EUKA|nr:hypothetical protein KIPB_014125 [Kipferlia bialata]|eukprot:g14125.t1
MSKTCLFGNSLVCVLFTVHAYTHMTPPSTTKIPASHGDFGNQHTHGPEWFEKFSKKLESPERLAKLGLEVW